MPIVSNISHILTASDCGTRVKILTSNNIPVNVLVGMPMESWPTGAVIEVVHVGDGSVTIIPADFSVTLNVMSKNTLTTGEYAKLVMVTPGVWDLHVHAIVQAATVVKPAPLTTVTTGSTLLTLGSALHHNMHYRCDSDFAVEVHIPPDTDWPGTQQYWENDYNPVDPGSMPGGGTILVGKHGAGDVTFVAGAGVTINTPSTLTISTLNGKVALTKVSENLWDIEGNLAP